MISLLVLGLGGQLVHRGLAEDPRLVYNQSIYSYLFDDVHPKHGVYNKNSPPIRKDDMTRYNDGMEIFEHSIDKFVDHHCDPYINFLESKCSLLQSYSMNRLFIQKLFRFDFLAPFTFVGAVRLGICKTQLWRKCHKDALSRLSFTTCYHIDHIFYTTDIKSL